MMSQTRLRCPGGAFGLPLLAASVLAACTEQQTPLALETISAETAPSFEFAAGPVYVTDVIDAGVLVGVPGTSFVAARAINESGQAMLYSFDAGNLRAHRWHVGSTRILGSLGGTRTFPNAMNDGGSIVGDATTSEGILQGFLWTGSGSALLNLTSPHGTEGRANAINNSSSVVGSYRSATTASFQGYIWQGGTFTDLGSLGGDGTWPLAVNDAGQVVGESRVAGSFARRAFLWEDGAAMTSLATPGGWESWAVAINESGHVIGNGVTSAGKQVALSWEDGTLTVLPDLGGPFAQVRDVNRAGQVAGIIGTPDRRARGTLWDGGSAIDLGTLGGQTSHVTDLNDVGQIVGSSPGLVSPDHAFVWRDGTMIDLGTLGGWRSGAESINEDGVIVGWSDDAAPRTRAVRWREATTPEEALGVLETHIARIVAGGLIGETEARPLQGALDIARMHLEAGRPGPAAQQLEIFVRHVERLVRGGALPGHQEQWLISTTGAVGGRILSGS